MFGWCSVRTHHAVERQRACGQLIGLGHHLYLESIRVHVKKGEFARVSDRHDA
eukprot:SAG31_NODE_33086_length_348_cov_0.618474_1_plen_52_part_10